MRTLSVPLQLCFFPATSPRASFGPFLAYSRVICAPPHSITPGPVLSTCGRPAQGFSAPSRLPLQSVPESCIFLSETQMGSCLSPGNEGLLAHLSRACLLCVAREPVFTAHNRAGDSPATGPENAWQEPAKIPMSMKSPVGLQSEIITL